MIVPKLECQPEGFDSQSKTQKQFRIDEMR